MTAESTPQRKKSIAWLVPATLGAGALVLSLVTGSLGAYTASIKNDNNTAGAGGLTMQETGPGADGTNVTCDSSEGTNNVATCATINKYGGKTTMAPGDVSTVNITLKNTGSIAAKAATLTPGACTQTPAVAAGKGDLCGLMNVVITQDGTEIFRGTAKELAAKSNSPITLTAPAAGASNAYKITTTLPVSADNTYAGVTISQPLTWTYTA
ncbi:hypothetical protein CWC38_00030 [Kocuria tytonicola]|uniref:hypothetical protein n=1 Tax=Kocuria tytonicola TaxID=2055946 RepID=UPI000EF87391|nr:hypothetical protein [Kocuria tytonicola]RLZ04458.1 hypothetical protein CWC38_00030 [Kocuria tytonicola]